MQDQYIPHNYKEEYQQAKAALERMGDFIEFLFEHSEHCDHITYSDAYAEFEKWEEEEYKKEQENNNSINSGGGEGK